jgi:methionyl-tRNA formyltransferase
MGTPGFALETLRILNERHSVILAVTQPDKPAGRKKVMTAPPVKELAERLGIPVFQPARLRESAGELRRLAPEADVFAVAAYGQILSEEILEMPKYGCFNVHASLLPEYRGAAPIQRAIMDGREKTGVTIMKMEKGLDTGPALLSREAPIEDSDTAGGMFEKLGKLGAEALIEALELVEAGRAVFTPQDEAAATYAHMLGKDAGRLDFSRPARDLRNLIRALSPRDSGFAEINGEKLKIWEALTADCGESAENGTIINISGGGITVKTPDGALVLSEVQPASGKRMSGAAFARGHKVKIGDKLI